MKENIDEMISFGYLYTWLPRPMDTDVVFPVTLKSTAFVPTTVPEAICCPFTSIEYDSFSEDCRVAAQWGYISPPEFWFTLTGTYGFTAAEALHFRQMEPQ